MPMILANICMTIIAMVKPGGNVRPLVFQQEVMLVRWQKKIPVPYPEEPTCIPECVTLSTTHDSNADGYVAVDVNGKNEVPKTKFYKGDIVLGKCYEKIDSISVQSTSTNGWIGTITMTRNGVPASLICNGCTGLVFNHDSEQKIVVDGNSDLSAGPDETYCLGGQKCTFTPSSVSNEQEGQSLVKSTTSAETFDILKLISAQSYSMRLVLACIFFSVLIIGMLRNLHGSWSKYETIPEPKDADEMVTIH